MEATPLRMARRGDLPSLHALWQAWLAEQARGDARRAPHPDAGPWLASHVAAILQDPDHVLLVAEEGGRLVVAFAVARLLPAPPGALREAEIGEVFVAPPRRRRGLARRLVQRTLDLLHERGVREVRAGVPEGHPGALAFGRSLGFEPVELLLQREA